MEKESRSVTFKCHTCGHEINVACETMEDFKKYSLTGMIGGECKCSLYNPHFIDRAEINMTLYGQPLTPNPSRNESED